MVALPATGLAYFTLGSAYWWAYPMMFIPSVFNLVDMFKLRFIVFRTEVYRMYLLKNGDQIVVETFDKMLHRLNIIDN